MPLKARKYLSQRPKHFWRKKAKKSTTLCQPRDNDHEPDDNTACQASLPEVNNSSRQYDVACTISEGSTIETAGHDHTYSSLTDSVYQSSDRTSHNSAIISLEHSYCSSHTDTIPVIETNDSGSETEIYASDSDVEGHNCGSDSDLDFVTSDTCTANDIDNVNARPEPELHELLGDDVCDTFLPPPIVDDSCTSKLEISTYSKLKCDLHNFVPQPYVMNTSSDAIELVEFYSSEGKSSVKLSVVIEQDFSARIFVHRKEVSRDNDIWLGLPRLYDSTGTVLRLLSRLSMFAVCQGNPEDEYQCLTPVGCGLSDNKSPDIMAYREGDFGASIGDFRYESTIRSSMCKLLVEGNRCSCCSDYRRQLRKRKQRLEDQINSCENRNFVHNNYKHKDMTRESLLQKIKQQRIEIKTLENNVDKLRRDCERQILQRGVSLGEVENLEMKDLMASCRDEVEKAFPDPNSYQRLFWEQQIKFEKSGKNGMRWHPMMIRWCLYLRQKSSKAYEALRDMGFIKLPSSRTLFDYSHYTTSALGFQADVLKMLKAEAEKKDLYSAPWKSYVGILFDEIRIKEDLVYDKNTGELIGYVNLDSVGNQILELEKLSSGSGENLAKFMLVLMVRGVATKLKFPLAGFATTSITADFLYPIIWRAVTLIEGQLKLKVLFCTGDGASANRRFFELHRTGDEAYTYYTTNPHDENRKIYFISDVPHLLKTVRNCFSNSFSHKCTRKMWKDGKDISWIHILRLFEEHCELDLYNPCPKLTRAHVDLTAFSCMKVNLAAQILSDTVANALETLYDNQEVGETVDFIRKVNKFFDCLNVRNLFEGRNKRNPNLNPYTSVDDERLTWLQTEFLEYFEEWNNSVLQRNGIFTTSERNAMKLSHQTLTGLKISVKSITECVRFMLGCGADFVLTHNFNQDPLEQHFGHYRHKGGSNNNPTVYEVKHIMNQIRTVGVHAVAPKRGNIRRENDVNPPIDNTKLQRRH